MRDYHHGYLWTKNYFHVSVTQKLYNPHIETSYVVTSETVDSTLPVPTIKSIDYGDGWVDVNCPGTFSQSDPYVGYEGYLSYNDKFAYSVQDMRTIGEDDGIGSVSSII